LLKEFGIRPDKSLGQHFLADPASLRRVVEIASLTRTEEVLEIGAGLGSLTRLLAVNARRVVAVEIDQDLIPALTSVLENYRNVEIIQGDILDLNPAELISTSGYLVVANIPYYITSAIIRHLMGAKIRPGRIVLTLQREVAERITAVPGDMSLLSLSVQVFGNPVIAGRISAGAFYPKPKVESAVIRIDLLDEPRIPTPDLPAFFHLARTAFAQKRKKIRNSLASLPGVAPSGAESLLTEAGISPDRRPETLSLDEWEVLVRVCRKYVGGKIQSPRVNTMP
jgi:16S rRNA (adenine1518-N6/adenine1519-N6)-dimethyltransferase